MPTEEARVLSENSTLSSAHRDYSKYCVCVVLIGYSLRVADNNPQRVSAENNRVIYNMNVLNNSHVLKGLSFYLAPNNGPAKVEVLTEADNSSVVTVQFLPPNDPNGALYRYKLEYKMGKVGT